MKAVLAAAFMLLVAQAGCEALLIGGCYEPDRNDDGVFSFQKKVSESEWRSVVDSSGQKCEFSYVMSGGTRKCFTCKTEGDFSEEFFRAKLSSKVCL